MHNYTLYRLDRRDRIVSGEWITAEDEEQALQLVRDLDEREVCEVWDADRKVGRIEGQAAVETG